jgi:hypothetical protein
MTALQKPAHRSARPLLLSMQEGDSGADRRRKRTIGIKRGYDELTNVTRDCSIEAYRTR